MISLEVVNWQLPPSLDAMLDKLARAEVERAAEEQRLAQAGLALQKPRPWYIRLLEALHLRTPPPLTPVKEPGK
jgi:hypothetical protein